MLIIPILIISLLFGGAFIYIIFEILEPKKWTMIGAVIRGALTGLGLGAVTSIFVMFGLGTPFPEGGYLGLIVEAPVLPFYILIRILIGKFLDGPGLFSETSMVLLIHFISWIIGCIFYALIFRWLRQRPQKNKKQ